MVKKMKARNKRKAGAVLNALITANHERPKRMETIAHRYAAWLGLSGADAEDIRQQAVCNLLGNEKCCNLLGNEKCCNLLGNEKWLQGEEEKALWDRFLRLYRRASRNLAVSMLRKRIRHRTWEKVQLAKHSDGPAILPEDEAACLELTEKLRTLMADEFTDKQREFLTMSMEGASYEEMARRNGVAPQSAKSAVCKVREKIRRHPYFRDL